MDVDVRYTAASDADLAIFDNFDWPEGTARVTAARCNAGNTCTPEDSTCCGSYAIQEDDGVTLE